MVRWSFVVVAMLLSGCANLGCWPNCAGHGSKFMASRDEFEQANQRAKDLEARIPRVVSAHYDRKTGRIVIHLSSKLIVSFSNRKPGLTKAETFAHLVAVVLRVRARITWPQTWGRQS